MFTAATPPFYAIAISLIRMLSALCSLVFIGLALDMVSFPPIYPDADAGQHDARAVLVLKGRTRPLGLLPDDRHAKIKALFGANEALLAA